jgi:hypothetical protein
MKSRREGKERKEDVSFIYSNPKESRASKPIELVDGKVVESTKAAA